MKTLKKFFIVLSLFWGLGSFKLIAGSSCTCQPGQTVCQADGGLMSCCTCCQRGSSCGAWSGFGLAGCSCENTSHVSSYGGYGGFGSTANVILYKAATEKYIGHLKGNGIDVSKIQQAYDGLITGLKTQIDNERGEFVNPSPASATKFGDIYFAEMERICKNDTHRKIIEAYINMITPKK